MLFSQFAREGDHKLRIVLDTNVIASAIFFGGKPRQLIDLLMEKQFDSFVTSEIVEEYHETIEFLCNKYPRKPISVPLTQIVSACNIIEPKSKIQVCRDPDDDKFIACAKDAKCLYIVSGDKDLLTVKKYDGVEIITVSDFLSRLFE